jgi:hypothetical protein
VARARGIANAPVAADERHAKPIKQILKAIRLCRCAGRAACACDATLEVARGEMGQGQLDLPAGDCDEFMPLPA